MLLRLITQKLTDETMNIEDDLNVDQSKEKVVTVEEEVPAKQEEEKEKPVNMLLKMITLKLKGNDDSNTGEEKKEARTAQTFTTMPSLIQKEQPQLSLISRMTN